MKVLVVAAHPDDEALGAGATLAKHVQAGDRVAVVFLADGEGSRGNVDHLTDRKKMAQNCANALGIDSIHFLDFPDNKMDSVPLLDIVQKIENYIREVRPDTVYTHNPQDLNIDHQLTARAVITACRPIWPFAIARILAFETLSNTEWSSVYTGQSFTPDYFVDCTETWSKKVAGLQCYQPEMRDFPHARSYEAVDALGIYRGVQVGVKKAEAFKVLRMIG